MSDSLFHIGIKLDIYITPLYR